METFARILPLISLLLQPAADLCANSLPALLKALAAKYWSSLRRPKRNCCFLVALRTYGGGLYPNCIRFSASAHHGHSFGFASPTTFRFILELFIVKEKLFPSRENEISSTIHTFQYFVLKFHLRVLPFDSSSAKRTHKGARLRRFLRTPSIVWNNTAPGFGPPASKTRAQHLLFIKPSGDPLAGFSCIRIGPTGESGRP